MRLIDADKLKRVIEDRIDQIPADDYDTGWNNAINTAIDEIVNAPTVSFTISPEYVTKLQNLNEGLIERLEKLERPTRGEKIMKDKTIEDKLKKAVADEFKYRASQGRINYSMEEAIYIVDEVIGEVFKWKALLNDGMESRINQENIDHLDYLDVQMREIRGDLKCLTEKVNELSSLLEERDKMPIPKFVEDKTYTDKSTQSGFGIPVGNNGFTPV